MKTPYVALSAFTLLLTTLPPPASAREYRYVFSKATTRVYCLYVKAPLIARRYGLSFRAMTDEADAYYLIGADGELDGHARYVEGGICEITVR